MKETAAASIPAIRAPERLCCSSGCWPVPIDVDAPGAANAAPREEVGAAATSLTPLEIVRVALDFEEMTSIRVRIEDLATVRDFAQLAARLRAQAEAARPRPPESLGASRSEEGASGSGAPCDDLERFVRGTIAAYLGRETDAVTPRLSLRDELEMRTLDIELIILRLEGVARAPFPRAASELVSTVGELTSLFRAVMSRAG